MSVTNRRDHARVSADALTATIRDAGGLFNKLKLPHECRVLDLSREGAGLLSATGLAPMSEIILTLETPDGLRVQLAGTVRFTNPVDATDYRIGVHFADRSTGANSAEALKTLHEIERQLAGMTSQA